MLKILIYSGLAVSCAINLDNFIESRVRDRLKDRLSIF